MKKLLIGIAICSISIINSFAQTGKMFPALSGETLDDKKINLPIDTKGKFTLVGMAYSKQAEEELRTWFQPVFTTFLEKPKGGLFNESYDVNIYFVPMFTGVNQAASATAKKKLQEGLDKTFIPHLIIYKGDLKPYKDQLDFEKKDTPYFFVLDKEGKIVYATSGKFTEEKLSKIESQLEEAE